MVDSGVRNHQGTQTILLEAVLCIARLFFLALLLASPWYYGSVSWYSQSIYLPMVLCLFFLSVIVATIQGERWGNPFVWSLAGLLAIAVLQTVPLPTAIWQMVSAGASFDRRIEPDFVLFSEQLKSPTAVNEASQIVLSEPSRTLSIHWVQTRASAATFAMALAWIVSASILFRTQRWELVLTVALGLGSLAFALLGLLQLVAWNHWTLLPMPTSSYFSTFVNRNSAPQFLAVGLGGLLGTLVWWSHTKSDHTGKKYYVRYPAVNLLARLRRRLDDLVIDLDPLSISLIISITVLYVATLASASRGGIVACCAASIVTLVFSLKASRNILRTVALITLMLSIGLLLLTSLDLDSAIVDRIATIDREAYELDKGRFTLWSMILSHPSLWISGCGLGNFHFAVVPTYRAELATWFYHAENIYLELLTDFGVVGFATATCGIAWLGLRLGRSIVQNRLYAPTVIASIFAISAIGLQSLVDFSLILPGVFLPAGALVGCFLGRSGVSDFGRKNRKENGKRKHNAVVQNKSHFWQQPLIALFILVVGFSGLPALIGFRAAEKVARELEVIEADVSLSKFEFLERIERVIGAVDRTTIDSYAWHPELSLQLGRGMQAYAQKLAESSNHWDPKFDSRTISGFSKPESIAAAYRSKSPIAEELVGLRAIAEDSKARQILIDSAQRMKIAAEACCFDWRAAWGVFRSDLNTLTPESRALNLARLANLANISFSLTPKIGNSCLIAGERQTAFTLLKRYLDRSPNMSGRLAEGLVNVVDKDELLELLPKSQLVIASVAEQLSRSKTPPSFIESFTKEIDLGKVLGEAENLRDAKNNQAHVWGTVEWLAEKQKNDSVLVEAYRYHVQADPMRHDLRANFAKKLKGESTDLPIEELRANRKNFEEALSQAEAAKRLAPDNQEYRALASELHKLLNKIN